MEFCELGDLSTFIRKRSTLGDHEATVDMIRKYPNPTVGGLNQVVARHFLQQMASGLQWIRKRNFLHRDIKPQNLLLVPSRIWREEHQSERQPLMADEHIDEPASGIESLPMLKIADFGFARFLPSLQLADTLCGSPLYMAPEILRYEKYDAKADLWSTGTVLYEMIVGKPPFRASNHVELISKIDKNNDKMRYPEGLIIGDDMKTVIAALLKRNPTERISYDNFFNDPVVSKPIPVELLSPEDRPQQEPTYNLASRSKPTKTSDQIGGDETPRRYSESSQNNDKQPSIPRSRPHSISHPSNAKPLSEKRPSVTSPDVQGKPKERRPTLTGHSPTAPARVGEKATSLVTGKRSPGSSQTREQLEQERRRVEERAYREAREKAAQDVAFERDYVVVDKNAVQVNAFADEIEHSPHIQVNQGAVARRAVSSNAPYSTTAPQSGSRPWPTTRPGPMHHRTTSLEKHLYGRSPTSASSAITKALNMATFRMWGLGSSPPNKPMSPPKGYNPFPVYPTTQGSGLLLGDGTKGVDSRDEDMRIALLAEKLASRCDVVWSFGEVKYQQLVPVRPIHAPGTSFSSTPKRIPEEPEDDDITVDQIVAIAEEALVLYFHALGILTKIFDITGNWFYQKKNIELETSPRSVPVRSTVSVTSKINSIVQWARGKFNDCLEKSEFVARKLIDAQKRLPTDHPGHPSNHPTSSTSSITANIGASADNITLTCGVTAEKLMYDRALEMSRMTAINELTNTDLESGEVNYRTAIQMLEAILDDGEYDIEGRRLMRKDDEVIMGLETEDRAMVSDGMLSTIPKAIFNAYVLSSSWWSSKPTSQSQEKAEESKSQSSPIIWTTAWHTWPFWIIQTESSWYTKLGS
jgi:serine/threonine-protein kinase ULK/ATG1